MISLWASSIPVLPAGSHHHLKESCRNHLFHDFGYSSFLTSPCFFFFFFLHHQLLELKLVEKNRWGLCYMSDVLIIATTTSNPIAPGSNLGKAV